MESSVIFFDNICVLCSSAVKLIYRNDPKGKFKFAAIDSDIFKQEAAERFKGQIIPDSIILLKEGKIYTRSGAALRIALGMRFPWPIFGVFLIVPPFLRDPIYNLVARYRYRWFGKREACYLPDGNMKSHFLS